MLWPKKNSYKEFDNEKKNSCSSKIPLPPITFLMVRPLNGITLRYINNREIRYTL